MFAEIGHYVGGFVKYLGAAAILVLSISLSFAMFTSIAPPDMPWFPWAALGLTDGGFVGWLVVFRMIKYHGPHKAVAFVMIWVCLAAALFTDAMELAHMFHIAPLFAGMYYYALIALLLGHFLALAIDELISEGQKYEKQRGLSPTQQPVRAISEQSQPKDERTFEQRATVKQLPPARSDNGFMQRFRNAKKAFTANNGVYTQEDIRRIREAFPPADTKVTPDMSHLDVDDDEQSSICSLCGGDAASGRVVKPGVYICPACIVDEQPKK